MKQNLWFIALAIVFSASTLHTYAQEETSEKNSAVEDIVIEEAVIEVVEVVLTEADIAHLRQKITTDDGVEMWLSVTGEMIPIDIPIKKTVAELIAEKKMAQEAQEAAAKAARVEARQEARAEEIRIGWSLQR